MIIDGTSDLIQFDLAGAVTTTELDFTSSFDDYSASTATPTNNDGTSNGTNKVTLVGSPAGSHQRKLNYCTIENKDTVSATVNIYVYDGSNSRQVFKAVLASGDMLKYDKVEGWEVITTLGNKKYQAVNVVVSSLRTPECQTVAAASSVVTSTSGTNSMLYLGKADRAYTSIVVQLKVTTAITATITYAEMAIYTTQQAQQRHVFTLQLAGFTDVSAIINSLGLKTVTITVAGIQPGDALYLIVGTVTSGTAAAFRAAIPDNIQSAVSNTLSGSIRPSLNPNMLSNGFGDTAIWCCWQGT